MIPTGGLSINTGAATPPTSRGSSAAPARLGRARLLDAYEPERRAIGVRNVAASRRAANGPPRRRAAWRPEIADDGPRGDAARDALAEVADREQRWSNELPGIELGYRYQDSPLIVADEAGGPDPDGFAYFPTTCPGARLPHLWLDDGTALHDRLGHGYTLLALDGDGDAALGRAFEARGAPFATLAPRSASAADVLEGHGSILVRPDLHIVWRGHGAAPTRTGWRLSPPATPTRARSHERAPRGGGAMTALISYDPATGIELGEVPITPLAEPDAVIGRAQAAFDGPWSRDANARSRALDAWGDAIAATPASWPS